MGWGRMLLLGNIGQQLDIGDTQEALTALAAQMHAGQQLDRQVTRTLDDLTRENAELKLYLAAVTRLLISKGVINQTELAAVIDAVDAADGKTDGRYTGPLHDPR